MLVLNFCFKFCKVICLFLFKNDKDNVGEFVGFFVVCFLVIGGVVFEFDEVVELVVGVFGL